MENKKYIKQMQKQIIELKKYIVELENTINIYDQFSQHLFKQRLLYQQENDRLNKEINKIRGTKNE